MEVHGHIAGEHTELARREFFDATTRLQVYGQPSDAALEGAMYLAETGCPAVMSEYAGGVNQSRPSLVAFRRPLRARSLSCASLMLNRAAASIEMNCSASTLHGLR
jgi:hypothetical protein